MSFTLLKKGIVVVIIVLFLSTSIVPTIAWSYRTLTTDIPPVTNIISTLPNPALQNSPPPWTDQTLMVGLWNNNASSWEKAQQNNTMAPGTAVRDIHTSGASANTTKSPRKDVLQDSYGKYTNATYSFTTRSSSITAPTVVTNQTTNIGNTNATLNMCLQNDGGAQNTLWFNCTEYHPAMTSGTGTTISSKWTRNIYSGTAAMSAAKDINGDGIMELFFAGAIPGSGNTVANICSLNGSSGAIIWSRNISCAGGYVDSHLPICIADFLDDGRYEMVFPFNTHTMCLWCNDGTTMLDVAVYSGYHQPLVYDVDNNGHPYVYVDGYISGTPASYYMWMLYGRNGTIRSYTTGTTVGVSDGGVSAGDPSHNGTIRIFTSQNLQMWDQNLTHKYWSYSLSSSSMAPALFDYYHNGFLVIAMTYSASSSCTVWVINATTGALIYSNASTGMGGHHNPGITDFNNDGNFEMATSHSVGLPKIWDLMTRRVDWTYPLSHGVSEPPMYANVLGDDALEMLICDSWRAGYISVFNTTYVWKTNVSGVFLNCMVWDVDGDGYNEIIGYRTQSTYCTITCFDTQAYAPVLRARGDTPFYGENKLNTGLYVPELNRKLVTGKANCTWSQKLYGLTPGTLYFSQAVAKNSKDTSCGAKNVFLTKPNAPYDPSRTNYTNAIKLSWMKGLGANTTYIERNTVLTWMEGAGTLVFNGTTTTCNNSGLTSGTTYYYRLWSFTYKGGLSQYSATNVSIVGKTLGLPPVNHPPMAQNDSKSVLQGSTNNQINVLANDSDIDGDPLTILSVTQPSNGTSSTNGTYCSYSPYPMFYGTDFFSYTINDGRGGTATATVLLTVTHVNHPPNRPIVPTGPTTLLHVTPGRYNASTTDPDGDQVQYRFDWNAAGTHDISNWTVLYPSGQTVSKWHAWNTAGTYVVKVAARDRWGAISRWSRGLMVVVT